MPFRPILDGQNKNSNPSVNISSTGSGAIVCIGSHNTILISTADQNTQYSKASKALAIRAPDNQPTTTPDGSVITITSTAPKGIVVVGSYNSIYRCMPTQQQPQQPQPTTTNNRNNQTQPQPQQQQPQQQQQQPQPQQQQQQPQPQQQQQQLTTEATETTNQGNQTQQQPTTKRKRNNRKRKRNNQSQQQQQPEVSHSTLESVEEEALNSTVQEIRKQIKEGFEKIEKLKEILDPKQENEELLELLKGLDNKELNKVLYNNIYIIIYVYKGLLPKLQYKIKRETGRGTEEQKEKIEVMQQLKDEAENIRKDLHKNYLGNLEDHLEYYQQELNKNENINADCLKIIGDKIKLINQQIDESIKNIKRDQATNNKMRTLVERINKALKIDQKK